MTTLFIQHLQRLAQHLGFHLPNGNFNCLTMTIAGRDCRLRTTADGTEILAECRLNTPLALDTTWRNRAAMEANFCFQLTAGATIALDDQDNLVLQRQFSLENLHTEHLQAIVEKLLTAAAQLDDAMAEHTPSQAPDNLPTFALKV